MTKDVSSPLITVETAREVMRLSEVYVDGTLRLSLASDGRALQMCNMLAAASTLLVGFAISTFFSTFNAPDPGKIALATSAICCGLTFIFALWFAVQTVLPRSFCIPGNLKSQWSEEELKGPLAEALLSQAAVYEGQALKNNRRLESNAKKIRMALKAVVLAIPGSLIIGIISFFLARHLI